MSVPVYGPSDFARVSVGSKVLIHTSSAECFIATVERQLDHDLNGTPRLVTSHGTVRWDATGVWFWERALFKGEPARTCDVYDIAPVIGPPPAIAPKGAAEVIP